jgi:predicted Rossmann fold nucleotide-binding protein DprA/Smf involved in DNA uptake
MCGRNCPRRFASGLRLNTVLHRNRPVLHPYFASLFTEEPLPAGEARVMSVLRHDEALQLDEIMEKLEPELSSSEVFTALFELELAGRIRQLPGKNNVKAF